MSDTDRTDIIGGLRPSDTPPLGSPLPHGPGRHSRRREMPMAAQIALWGTPVAAVMVTAGLWLGADHGPAAAPSPVESSPAAPVVQPSLPEPSATPTRGDRSRPRRTTAVVAPSTTRSPERSASPSPTRTRTATPTPSPSVTDPWTPSPSPSGGTPSDSPAPPTIPAISPEASHG